MLLHANSKLKLKSNGSLQIIFHTVSHVFSVSVFPFKVAIDSCILLFFYLVGKSTCRVDSWELIDIL